MFETFLPRDRDIPLLSGVSPIYVRRSHSVIGRQFQRPGGLESRTGSVCRVPRCCGKRVGTEDPGLCRHDSPFLSGASGCVSGNGRLCWSVILEMRTVAGNSWFEDLPSSSPAGELSQHAEVMRQTLLEWTRVRAHACVCACRDPARRGQRGW